MRSFFLLPAALLAAASCATPVDVTPPVGPVTAVTLAGADRIKVGDLNQLTASAFLEDGSWVYRPVAWQLVDPAAGTVSTAGVLVAAHPGPLQVRATVEGVTAVHAATAYDWQADAGQGVAELRLSSHQSVKNRDGVPTHPNLVVRCTAGAISVSVIADEMEVTHPRVQYTIDGGELHDEHWYPGSDGTLTYPGATNALRTAFALRIAAAHELHFAFGEHDGDEHAVKFRVVGLGPRLAPLLAGCDGE